MFKSNIRTVTVRRPFQQLFTINAFMRTDDQAKQVPLVYLLSDIWGGSPSTTSLPFGIDGEYDETPGSSGTISDREGEGSEGRLREF